MIKKILFLLLAGTTLAPLRAQDFKVVGYLPYYRFGSLPQLSLKKLTHLNIAFANPDSNGNFSVPGNMAPVVAAARNANVKVLVSIAGGDVTAAIKSYYDNWMQPAKVSAFAGKLAAFVRANQLDGVDVDLEWSNVNTLYNGFVKALSDSLRRDGRLLTAALPGTYRYPEVTDATLALYDFINLMVYDLRGPWNPADIGPHAPYSFAVSAIDYWNNKQRIPLKRLTLGLPFYGYNFGQAGVPAVTYGQMVAKNPAYAFLDQVDSTYYNGINTIVQKTRLALSKPLAGVMIWELGQDALGALQQYSLLNAIDNAVKTAVPVAEIAEGEGIPFVFGNPFRETLAVSLGEAVSAGDDARLILSDLSGRIHCSVELEPGTSGAELRPSGLSNGLYLVSLVKNGRWHTGKAVKME